MNNRGEMTVAKLVTIILAVVVLVLVIVGVATGALKPLEEKVNSFFNRVSLWFGGNLPDSQNCQIYSANCPGGCIRIGQEDLSGSFSLCKDACYLVTDEKETIIAKEGKYTIRPNSQGVDKYYYYNTYRQYLNQELLKEKDGNLIKTEQKVYAYDYKELKLKELHITSEGEINPLDITRFTTEEIQTLIKIYKNLYASMIEEDLPYEDLPIKITTDPKDKQKYPVFINYNDIMYSIDVTEGAPNEISGFFGVLEYKKKKILTSEWVPVSPEIDSSSTQHENIINILTLFQEECK